MKTLNLNERSNSSNSDKLHSIEGISVGNQFSATKNIEIKISKEAI